MSKETGQDRQHPTPSTDSPSSNIIPMSGSILACGRGNLLNFWDCKVRRLSTFLKSIQKVNFTPIFPMCKYCKSMENSNPVWHPNKNGIRVLNMPLSTCTYLLKKNPLESFTQSGNDLTNGVKAELLLSCVKTAQVVCWRCTLSVNNLQYGSPETLVTCVTRKQTFRFLSLSCQKKDGRV